MSAQRSGRAPGWFARTAGRGAVAGATAAALVVTMLVPGEPAEGAEQTRPTAQDVAAWARAAAAPADEGRHLSVVADGPAADDQAQAAPDVWGSALVRPDEGGEVAGGDVAVSFSGYGLDAAVDVTVSALDAGAGASAADGITSVVLGSGFDITAVDAEGDRITEFPRGPIDGSGAADPSRGSSTTDDAAMPFTSDADGSALIGGLPIGRAAHPDGANFDVDDSARSVAGDDDAAVPGVRIEVRVDPAALVGVRAGSVRLMTRGSDADPWSPVPSYLDVATSTVVGELDHLSQFVVIGGKDTGDPRPRVVLDPDNDRGYATGPGPSVSEVGYNVRLANEVASRLNQVCHADVVVTRPTPVAEMSRAVRAGMASAHQPDLTLTIGFNSTTGGAPWGNIGNGGSEVYARGGALDEQARATMLAVLPAYTGRPANARTRSTLPYDDYQGLPGVLLHLETLYLNHNFDRPVIDDGFTFIADGVLTSLGMQLEAQGFDCVDPDRGGGWPSPPSLEQVSAWMQLGFTNYQAYGGDPVSFSTGNLVELEDLFHVSGPGGSDTQVALVHNSMDGRLSRFGTGWTSDLTARAQRFTDGSVMVVRGDGRSFVFAPDGVGGYTADANAGATLAEAPGGHLLLHVDDGTTWEFDASHPEGVGDVVARTDPHGAETRFEYGALVGDPMFRPLAAVVLPGEQRIVVTSDVRGLVTALAAPDGRTWTLGYDDALDLRTITLPDGRMRSFDYDGAHRVTTARDATGAVFLTTVYDVAGRVVTQGDGVGGTRTFAWRADGVDYTDAAGSVWSYEVDARSRVTRITDPLGQVTATEYGTLDAPVAVVEPDGARTAYTLDARGRTTGMVGPDGATTSLVLDDQGWVLRAENPGPEAGARLVTELERDEVGRVVRSTAPGGAAETTERDADGNPVRVTDAVGQVWTATFDQRGNRLTSTDPLGRTTGYDYDAGNRLVATTTPSGSTWSSGYDTAGRLVTETDPAGAVTAYGYDANDNLVSVTDPTGAVTTQVWDTGRRLVQVTDPLGSVTRYEHNPEDVLTAVIDPTGAVLRYDLDAAHRVVATTDPTGGRWSRTLDAAGRVVGETDPDGGTSTWEYDAAGRVLVETDADGVATGYAYGPGGQVVELRDSAGQVTTFTYDAAGLLASANGPDGTSVGQEHDGLGRVVATTDQAGRVAHVGYDAAGQVVTETDRTGAVTTYEYDRDGRVVASTDPDGVRETSTVDAVGRVLSTGIEGGARWAATYDAAGRVTVVTDGAGGAWTSEHDAAGRVVRTVDPTGAATRYGYDAAGRHTSSTDPDGVVTVYGYDAAGALVEVTRNATDSGRHGPDENVTTTYGYTGTGGLASVTDPSGAETAYGYTPGGRVASETDPLGSSWTSTYDAAGRLAAQTDPDGRTSEHRYDAAGRIVQTVHGHGGQQVTVGFEYDAVGNLIVMTDPSGTTGWTYDAEGRGTAERTAAGTLVTAYSAAGRRSTQTTPDGTTSAWSYDAAGRLESQTTPAGVMAYGYDDADRVTAIVRTNADGSPGPVTGYGYDAVGRTTQVSHRVTEVPPAVAPVPGAAAASCGACLPGADYLAGRVLPGTGTVGSGVWDIQIEQTFTATGHVASSARTDSGGAARSGAYDYDPLGRLVGGTEAAAAAEGEPATVTVLDDGYDAAGNRTRAAVSTPDGVSDVQQGRYDAANRLVRTTRSTTTPEVEQSSVPNLATLLGADPADETTEYTYDRAGHRTAQVTSTPGDGFAPHQTGSRVYAYGPDGLLTSISDPDRTIALTRDGLGRAAATTTTTEFVAHTARATWDGLTPVATADDAFGTTAYTRDVTGAVAVQTSARPSAIGDLGDGALPGGGAAGAVWELTDTLGSVIAQVDGDTITQVAWYDAWGVQDLTATAGWDADHGYTSETTDTGLGAVLFYARTYDPATGQFTTMDPWSGLLTEPGTLHAYAYVLADPLSLTDTLGYWPDWGAVGGWISDHKREIVGAVVGTVVAVGVGACIVGTGGLCAGGIAAVASAAGSSGLAGLGVALGVGTVSGAAGGAASYAVTGDGGQYSWCGAGRAVGVGAGAGFLTGGVGFGVTAGLRALGNRITAVHTLAQRANQPVAPKPGPAAARSSRPGATSSSVGSSVTVHAGKQGKHQIGHPNYRLGASVLEVDPARIVPYLGAGRPMPGPPRGAAGFKESIILPFRTGIYVNKDSTIRAVTRVVTAVYDGSGRVHFIPGRPQ